MSLALLIRQVWIKTTVLIPLYIHKICKNQAWSYKGLEKDLWNSHIVQVIIPVENS